jgi:hypothetical protein
MVDISFWVLFGVLIDILVVIISSGIFLYKLGGRNEVRKQVDYLRKDK